MTAWLPGIATIVALSVFQVSFGEVAALWLGTVVLAYCIGVFWGAGDQIRKHRDRDPHP